MLKNMIVDLVDAKGYLALAQRTLRATDRMAEPEAFAEKNEVLGAWIWHCVDLESKINKCLDADILWG